MESGGDMKLRPVHQWFIDDQETTNVHLCDCREVPAKDLTNVYPPH